MTGTIAFLLALCLTPAFSRTILEDPLLTNNNNDLPTSEKDLAECPDPMPVTTTGVPGVSDDQRLEISTQKGKAFRNITCIGDKPKYSTYISKISDIKGDWWGDMYYDVNGFPTFDLNWLDPYNKKVKSRKVVTFKEFVELPAPNASDAPWARYRVLSDDGTPLPFKYVERADTQGGAAPETCGGKSEISVPFEGYFYFYLCRDPKTSVSPSTAEIQSPALETVPPEAVPPPTAAAPPPSVEVPPSPTFGESPSPPIGISPSPPAVDAPSPSPAGIAGSSPEQESANGAISPLDGPSNRATMLPILTTSVIIFAGVCLFL